MPQVTGPSPEIFKEIPIYLFGFFLKPPILYMMAQPWNSLTLSFSLSRFSIEFRECQQPSQLPKGRPSARPGYFPFSISLLPVFVLNYFLATIWPAYLLQIIFWPQIDHPIYCNNCMHTNFNIMLFYCFAYLFHEDWIRTRFANLKERLFQVNVFGVLLKSCQHGQGPGQHDKVAKSPYLPPAVLPGCQNVNLYQ